MVSRAIMAMGGLAVVLGCLVLTEAVRAGGPLATLSRAPAPAAQNIDLVAPTQGDHSALWVATSLARPLFDPSRRPPAKLQVAKGRQNGLPRLSGIMITPTARLAIFAPASGKPIVIGEGSHIGAFTVRQIGADQVTVTGPHGTDVLHTAFSGTGDKSGPAPKAKHPASSMFGIPVVGKTAGGIVLNDGKTDLPNAATWSGPPSLSQLMQPKAPPPASKSLLDNAASATKLQANPAKPQQ